MEDKRKTVNSRHRSVTSCFLHTSRGYPDIALDVVNFTGICVIISLVLNTYLTTCRNYKLIIHQRHRGAESPSFHYHHLFIIQVFINPKSTLKYQLLD